ncbi:hypothetical protein PTTW11_11061 [Pyrenophora teres f. teres]|uniref:Uncharacterized protein n=1 Tax=Pyrenophora teres f. teres TaxID=97479 RepID=A0A6S6WF70_9PLEO|nr:hypothetical protein PTTW11_11061 [Pyrenophora teres f. teres]
MAALAVVKIPKAISGPSGPSVPSFLTTLSPELRNNIYEYLFELHLLVLLHDEEAYRHFLVAAYDDNRHLRTALENTIMRSKC